MCCSFNMKKAEEMLRYSRYRESVAIRQSEETQLSCRQAVLDEKRRGNENRVEGSHRKLRICPAISTTLNIICVLA